MRRWLVVLGAALLVGAFSLLRPAPDPLASFGYLKEQPDFTPPAFPVTVYSTNGPYSVGVIQAIAVDRKGRLFVGTYGEGIFRSDDSGRSWSSANRGLGDGFIISLTSLPDGSLFAGTIRAGLFKTTDGGESWVPAREGIGFEEVSTLASAGTPSKPLLLAGTARGLFLSENGGLDWRALSESGSAGLNGTLVRAIAVGPDHRIYLATQGKGVVHSEGIGGPWVSGTLLFVEAGIAETTVRTVAVSRENIVYAGTLTSGIFLSRDRGQSWEPASAGLKNLSIRSLVIGPKGELIAGTGLGVFQSDDKGREWREIWAIPEAHIQSMALAGDRLYVGTNGGLFVRETPGEPFKEANNAQLLTPQITSIASRDSVAVVGTAERGVFRSKDGGAAWFPINRGLPDSRVFSVEIEESGAILAAIPDGIYERDSEGEWRPLSFDSPGSVEAIAESAGVIYAGTSRGLFARSAGAIGAPRGMLASAVAQTPSERWRQVTQLAERPVHRILRDGKSVVAISDLGIFINSDAAQPFRSWTRLGRLPRGAPKAVSYKDGRLLAYYESGLFYLQPGGEAAEEIPLNISGTVRSLALASRDLILVGTDEGLFYSEDLGKSWENATSPFGRPYQRSILMTAPHPSGALFVASTSGVDIAFLATRRSLLR